MSDARTAARAALVESTAEQLTRRRPVLQSAAEAAGLSLDEIDAALKARKDLPRRLLPEEHEALVAVLQHQHFLDRDKLLLQAEEAQVVGYCACGCASVDLVVPPTAPRAHDAPSVVPTSADILDSDGEPAGGLVVFVADGYLSMLEVFGYVQPISPTPPITRISFT